jgi:stage V sporulation protein R
VTAAPLEPAPLEPAFVHPAEGRRGMRTYDLAELARLDDEVRAATADLGLDVPEIVFHFAPAERIYDIAARGLPGRYAHWRFGQAYERMKLDHDHGRSRIYELVLNTRPYQAYLLEGNSWVSQLLVIAHVYGHCWFFEHNAHFAQTDRKVLARVRAGAERIESYARRHGRTEVEDLLDAVQALAVHAPAHPRPRRPPTPPPPPEPVAYPELFPDEVAAARAEHERVLREWARREPKEPEEDILGYVLEHAPRLEDWERDVISIVRAEAAYLAPQRRTKIANEGFACWVHDQIVQGAQLGTEEFWEYNRLNADICQPHPQSVNPYNLGRELWREVERIYDDPRDDEAERFPGAGEVRGRDRVLELAAVCDDHALVSSFLTPDVCERARLMAVSGSGPGARVTPAAADELRSLLVGQLTHLGVPRLLITDADAFRSGALWVVHRHEGVGLDHEYAINTVPHLTRLWGRRVVVETVRASGEGFERIWYAASPGQPRADLYTSRPTS